MRTGELSWPALIQGESSGGLAGGSGPSTGGGRSRLGLGGRSGALKRFIAASNPEVRNTSAASAALPSGLLSSLVASLLCSPRGSTPSWVVVSLCPSRGVNSPQFREGSAQDLYEIMK